MQLRFYANMRTVMGKSSLVVDDARVDSFRKLVNHLTELFPEAAFHLLDGNRDLRKDVPVFVDGRNPRLSTLGIDTPLKPDSVVSFFSPISSGRMNVEVLREPTFGKRRPMKVNFFATLRDIAGGKTVEFDVDQGVTAKELLDAIIVKFPLMNKELLNVNGEMYGHVHFFINGRDVQFTDDKFQTKIMQGDTVNVFPAVGGG